MISDNSEQTLKKDKTSWLKIIPVVGWLYIILGFIIPFDNILLRLAWYIDIALSVGLHSLQLFIAIPIGRKAGISDKATVMNTMLYGATWWRPLQKAGKEL